jgi:amidase
MRSNTLSVQVVQTELKLKIPQQWRLPDTTLATKPRNITPIFRTCGILSARELEITEVEDCTALLSKIHSKDWSAVEAVTAFCKRAAIAQQLVNPLMDIAFDEGVRRAKELDDYLQSTGKVVGPLHGLPISFKVRIPVRGESQVS